MSWERNDIITFLKDNPRGTLQEFARQYGVTKQAISDRLKKMNLNWKELKDEAIANQIKKYIEEHPKLTKMELEEEFNLTYEAIRAEAAKYGVKIKIYRDNKATKAEIEEYMRKKPNATISECANYFKVGYSTMYRRFEKYGLSTKISKRKERERIATILKEDKLREYIKEHPGTTIHKMAENLKVNNITLKKYLKLYGINLTGLRNIIIEKNRIEEVIKKNPSITIKDMSEYFGISRNIMKKHLSFYGIKLSGKKVRFGKEDLEEYIKSNPNSTQVDIARYFKVSESTIYKYMKLYDLKGREKKKAEYSKESIEAREELLLKILDILNSVKGISIKRLKIFLESKGINVSEEEILQYQNKLQQENRISDEEER